jgi:hypothetical protein
MSVTRKINLWFFGKPDIENKYTISEKNASYLTRALISYLETETQVDTLKIIFNLFN